MNTDVNFPKILHSGYEPIGSPHNTGITLASMFDSWPADKLLQFCLRENLAAPDKFLSLVAPPSTLPIDAIVRRTLGTRMPAGATDGLNHSISRRNRRIPLGEKLRNGASVLNDLGPVNITPGPRHKIEEFSPDVVHSLLGSVRSMRIALALSLAHDVPILPHFMDDWPSTLYLDYGQRGYPRRRVSSLLDAVLRRSPITVVIGEDMQTEYEHRYQRPAVVVGNSVDFDEYRRLSARSPVANNGRPRLRYVGGLHLGRADAIARTARYAEMVDPLWGIEIFVPAADSRPAQALADRNENIEFGGSLTPSEVPRALSNADALLFIESDDKEIAKFTQLSVSTKVPQYLAAGKPIVCVGDAHQGSVSSIMRSGRGYLVNPAAPGELAPFTLLLSRPETPRNESHIRELFDTKNTQQRLHEAADIAIDRWARA